MIKETSALTIMGLLLKEARLEKKETQSSISKHVGMTNAGWGRLENGMSSLSVENMMLACDFLDITPNLLFININRITLELKRDGWIVDISNVENDGLLIGRGLENSNFSKRLMEDKQGSKSSLSGAAARSAAIAAIGGGGGIACGAVIAGNVAAATSNLYDVLDLSTTLKDRDNKREPGMLIRKLAAIYIKSEKLFS